MATENQPQPPEKRAYRMVKGVHLLPWHIATVAPGGHPVDAILIATLEGNEIQTVSLHVARPGATEEDGPA